MQEGPWFGKAAIVKELMKVKSEFQAGGTRVLSRSVFAGGGAGAEAVNSFLKYFCAQRLCSWVGAFASLRVGASVVFGAVVGREKKAL
jgi:hypothetical protein